MTPQWATSSWSPTGLARADWAAVRDQVAVAYPSAADATAHRGDFVNLGAGLWVYDNEQWRSEATNGITRFLEPFTIAGYVVMAAAGLSVLNVFVLGLVQRKRERAALRAIGVTSGQEQVVIIANAGLLGVLVAGLAVLGGVGLTYLWSLGSPVYYGIKIEWGVPQLALRTGVDSGVYSRPGCCGVSRDPCAPAGDGRGAANQLTVAPQASREPDGAVVECRRLHAETCAGAPESRGLTWPRSPWAATSFERPVRGRLPLPSGQPYPATGTFINGVQ